MRYVKPVVYTLLITFVLLSSIFTFLLTTTPGMYITLKLANFALPGHIYIKKPHGHLLSPMKMSLLGYEDEAIKIQLRNIELKWSLKSLFYNQVNIQRIHADKLLVHIKDTPKAMEKAEKVDWSFPELPFPVKIQDLTLAQFELIQLGESQTLDKVHLHATLSNQKWDIHSLHINHFLQHFILSAEIHTKTPYQVDALLKFSPLKKHPDGFEGQISLQGDLSYYHWQGRFRGPAIGTIEGSLKHAHDIQTNIQWKDAKWRINPDNTLQSEKGRIQVQGIVSDFTIHGDVDFNNPVSAHWNFKAQVKNEKAKVQSALAMPEGTIHSTLFYDHQATPLFHGEIKSKSFNLASFSPLLGHMTFNTYYSGSSVHDISTKTQLTVRYMEHLLRVNIDYDPQHFVANATLGANQVHIQGKTPYPLQGTLKLPQPGLLHPALSGLNSTLDAAIDIKDAQHGTLKGNLHSGVYRTPDEPNIEPIPFEGGYVNLNLTPQGLKGKAALTIDRHKQLAANLQLPQFRLHSLAPATQPLSGELHLDVNALNFLAGISKAIEDPKGQINAVIKADGTLANPVFSGHLELKSASVYLPDQDLKLNPIELTLTTQNRQWKGTGSIGANGKSLLLSGDGYIAPVPKGQVSIRGQAFPIMKTAEYSFLVSPDLTIQFEPNLVDIQGSVLVPSGEVKPISFSDTVDLTSDAVFVSDKKQAEPINISTDVTLTMGDDVKLDVKGLQGLLQGSLKIKKIPKGEPFAIGELRVQDGSYKAYGQDLNISHGELLFTGGRITNPGIRLRAVRHFNNTSGFSGSNQIFDFTRGNIQSLDFTDQVTVGIEVTGRIETPEVRLFSIPSSLSQADTLSMLLLGKPASQASSSGGQLLLSAISSMNLDSGTKGTQLLQQMQNTLGLDFDMQTTSSFNQQSNEVTDQTAFVVGKPLSDRLYLSYNIGLFQEDSNVLTLKYMLNKFFSIQVTASDSGSGIDLLYSRSKK